MIFSNLYDWYEKSILAECIDAKNRKSFDEDSACSESVKTTVAETFKAVFQLVQSTLNGTLCCLV